MFSYLFILRCHRFDVAEKFLLQSVLPYFGKDNILVVVDERLQNINVNEWKKASLTNQRLQDLDVLNHPHCGWLCGDYFLYTAFKTCPNYDYYWLCEPDVYFSFDDIKDFFDEFTHNSADLLAPYFSQSAKDWYWTEKAKIISENVYGCLFSVLRISQKGIKHLHKERVKLSDKFRNKELKLEDWPNDESFVSTVLQRDHFICQALNSICNFFDPNLFGLQRRLWDNVINAPPSNKVLHSVLQYEQYQPKVVVDTKAQITHYIHTHLINDIFPHTTSEDSLDIATNILSHTYKELKIGLLKIHPNLINDKLDQLDEFFKELQTSTNHNIKQHSINKRYREYNFQPARAKDFVLEDEKILQNFYGNGFSPYAFNYLKKVFYLAENDIAIQKSSFFYQAQFQNASSIVTFPLNVAKKIYGAKKSLAPSFIFSIEQRNLALLANLTESINKVYVSEPDIFTTFVPNRTKINSVEGSNVLFYTVRALEQFFSVSASQLVIRLRPDCNKVCQDIYETFPDAHYIFLISPIYIWSKSVIENFNCNNKLLFNTLTDFIDALCFFKRNNIQFNLLSYETLMSNPVEVIKLLTDDISNIEAKVINSVLHFQTSTEQHQKNIEIEAQVKKFEKFWHTNKPVKKLKYLNIDL